MLVKSFFKKIRILHIPSMANSKFEYVRNYETDDRLLPNCWIVVRIDGRNFHKFAKKHRFEKPNDSRALDLMNRAALSVMEEFKDVVLAYGQSDEYSFVVRKDTELFNRRASKISTCINSLFSSSYVYYWSKVIDSIKLKYPPTFDARVVLYPTDVNLKDYLAWRQVDCHINNLYNTAFWNLVQKGGLSNDEAEKRLRGTLSAEKNEILFSAFGINYNNENIMFKKGTILMRKRLNDVETNKSKIIIMPLHEDFIKETFWTQHPEILGLKPLGTYTRSDNKPLPKFILEQRCFANKEVKES